MARRRQDTTALESRLVDELISGHPARTAVALERLGLKSTNEFFAALSTDQLAAVVPLLSPQFGAETIAALPIERIVEMLELLPLHVGSRIARVLGDRVGGAVERLSRETGDSLRSLLRFPPETAGGLMDPRVLALPIDLRAGEALDRVRELSENARYNLYVVDRDQVLVGVLNLRELFLARPDAILSELMVTNPYRLKASVGRADIVTHPGWREAHSIPVVDDDDRYVGAIRYRTLRRLEDSLRAREEDETVKALGELLAIGAGGIVRALTADGPKEES